MTEKQYPELPEPRSFLYEFVDQFSKEPIWRTEASVWNGQYPKRSMGLYTADQVLAFADATCAMRAAQAAPASQDAEDAARYRGLRDLAKEQLLYPQRAASSLAADMRTHWELPVLICSGPIGGYRDFDSAVDRAINAARSKQEGK